MANQHVPQVTAADVERVVRRDYPPDRIQEAFRLVEEYGKERWHREVDRVRIAALRLADGDLNELRRAIGTANQDYRDVIAPAEYPNYLAKVMRMGEHSESALEEIIAEDRKQYEDWLTR